jgi:hypothetical protein
MDSNYKKEDHLEHLYDEFISKSDHFKSVINEHEDEFQPLEFYTDTLEYFSENKNIDRCLYELKQAHIFFDKTITKCLTQ